MPVVGTGHAATKRPKRHVVIYSVVARHVEVHDDECVFNPTDAQLVEAALKIAPPERELTWKRKAGGLRRWHECDIGYDVYPDGSMPGDVPVGKEATEYRADCKGFLDATANMPALLLNSDTNVSDDAGKEIEHDQSNGEARTYQ